MFAHLELDECLVGTRVVAAAHPQCHRHRRHQEGQHREADEQGHQPPRLRPRRTGHRLGTRISAHRRRRAVRTARGCLPCTRAALGYGAGGRTRRRRHVRSGSTRGHRATPRRLGERDRDHGFVLRVAVLLRRSPSSSGCSSPTTPTTRSHRPVAGPGRRPHHRWARAHERLPAPAGLPARAGALARRRSRPRRPRRPHAPGAGRHRHDPAAGLDRVPPRGPDRGARGRRGVGAVAAGGRDGDGRVGDVARGVHGRRRGGRVDPGLRRPHPHGLGAGWEWSPGSRCSPASTCCCSSRSSRCGNSGAARAANSWSPRSVVSSSSRPGGSTARCSSARRSPRAGAPSTTSPRSSRSGRTPSRRWPVWSRAVRSTRCAGSGESRSAPRIRVLLFAVFVVLLAALAWWCWATRMPGPATVVAALPGYAIGLMFSTRGSAWVGTTCGTWPRSRWSPRSRWPSAPRTCGRWTIGHARGRSAAWRSSL